MTRIYTDPHVRGIVIEVTYPGNLKNKKLKKKTYMELCKAGLRQGTAERLTEMTVLTSPRRKKGRGEMEFRACFALGMFGKKTQKRLTRRAQGGQDHEP